MLDSRRYESKIVKEERSKPPKTTCIYSAILLTLEVLSGPKNLVLQDSNARPLTFLCIKLERSCLWATIAYARLLLHVRASALLVTVSTEIDYFTG